MTHPTKVELTIKVWTDDGDITTVRVPELDMVYPGAALAMRDRAIHDDSQLELPVSVKPQRETAERELLFAVTGRLIRQEDGSLFSQVVERATTGVDVQDGPDSPKQAGNA